MKIKTLLMAAIGGAAVWKWAGAHKDRTQQRLLSRPLAKPKDVTTWEGEGGALRGSGAQLGPAPELP